MFGFGPGDSFISKLESRRTEVADEPHILELLRAARAAYIALIGTGLSRFSRDGGLCQLTARC
jgi:hypothetical protein